MSFKPAGLDNCSHWLQGSQYSYWHSFYPTDGREQYSNLHDGGGELLFADGHVAFRKGKDLRSGDFGLLPATDDWTGTVRRELYAGFLKG
jgi:prepilin-type processing-associated H-X9-DG protein